MTLDPIDSDSYFRNFYVRLKYTGIVKKAIGITQPPFFIVELEKGSLFA